MTAYNTILFKYKDRTERISTDTEQDITTAIIKVVQGGTKKVYFTQGHGEKDAASGERDGYKGIADSLSHENYTVDKLILAQSGAVPDDAAVVVVAGPKTDFFPGEITALTNYLGKTGKLLLELDPPDRVDSQPLTNLVALAHDWGIDVGNNIVVDVSGMGQLIGTDQSVPVAASYPAHPITRNFKFLTAYPFARSVTPVAGGVNGHTAQGFVETSPRSWAESDIKGLLTSGKVSFKAADGDKQGPITVAAAVSAPSAVPAAPGAAPDAPKPETRVVVYGDSDFAANSGLGIQGNRDLFMNTVGWLTQQENLIAIRPKDADDRRVTMTAAQQTNVTWLALFIIPGFVFSAGVTGLVDEARIDARTQDDDRTARRARRPGRVHLLRHVEATGRRHVRVEAREGVRRPAVGQGRRDPRQLRVGRLDAAQERQRRLADRRAGRRGRAGFRGHRHRVRAVAARSRARHRRKPGQPRGLRPRRAASRDRLQGPGRQKLQEAAHRAEVTDRREPLRQAE